MKLPAALLVALIVFSSSLFAQWPKFKQPGVPRDSEGRVLTDARTPRTPDGKPDLSGVWMRADRDPLPQELAGVVTARWRNQSRCRARAADCPFCCGPEFTASCHFL